MTIFKFQGEFQEFSHEYPTVAPDGTETLVKESWSLPTRYIGGVPARDLTQEEWDALPDATQKQALDTGLYKAAGAERKAPHVTGSDTPARATSGASRGATPKTEE